MHRFWSWISPGWEREVTPTGFMKEAWQKQPAIFWLKEFGVAGVAKPAAREDSVEAAPSSTTPPSTPAATTRQHVLAILKDFADNSYISGVTLACRANIPLWDRLFWVTVVLVAVGIVVREMPRTYRALYEHPCTVEVLSTTMALHDFPFPAVVICPAMKVRKRAAVDFIKRFNPTDDVNETMLLPALTMLQEYRLPYWQHRDPPKLPQAAFKLFRGIDLRQFMNDVAPDCATVFHTCLWSGNFVDCCTLFRPTVSNAGNCFAFNSFTTPEAQRDCPLISVFERSLEPGAGIWYYHRPNKTGCVLARTSGAASGSGLQVYLRAADPLDAVAPEGRSSGFEVSVQAANENPDMDRGVYVRERRGQVTSVKVTYSETTADPWISQLPQDQRLCLFEDETPPHLFDHVATKWYTQETCMLACRLEFLVERCGCYPYIVPKQDNQCTLEQYLCYVELNKRLFWVRVPEEVGVTAEERNHSLWPDCRPCRPMCSLSVYDTEYETYLTAYVPASNTSGYVNVFFRDLRSAIKYVERRDKEPFEVILSYAASMNLLLGVSLMTVVQLAMYTVEVAAALWRPLWPRLLAWHRRWWRPLTPTTLPPTPPVKTPTSPLPFVL